MSPYNSKKAQVFNNVYKIYEKGIRWIMRNNLYFKCLKVTLFKQNINFLSFFSSNITIS